MEAGLWRDSSVGVAMRAVCCSDRSLCNIDCGGGGGAGCGFGLGAAFWGRTGTCGGPKAPSVGSK